MEKICPQCGHVNRAAGIFCANCGARLSVPPRADSRRRPFRPFAFLWSLIKVAISLAAVALLVGLFWPPSLPAPVTDAARAEAFDDAVERLRDAVERRQRHAEVIPAQDINAYLSRQIAASGADGAGGGMTAGLRQVRVDLERECARVTVDASYGPARIVMAVAGRPAIVENRFQFQIEQVQIGRIPVPVRYGGWIADKVRSVVQNLERERQLLDAAQQFEIKEGLIRVTVGPGRAPGA